MSGWAPCAATPPARTTVPAAARGTSPRRSPPAAAATPRGTASLAVLVVPVVAAAASRGTLATPLSLAATASASGRSLEAELHEHIPVGLNVGLALQL